MPLLLSLQIGYDLKRLRLNAKGKNTGVSCFWPALARTLMYITVEMVKLIEYVSSKTICLSPILGQGFRFLMILLIAFALSKGLPEASRSA